ncbi:MAG TPA: hypothetical protein VGV38_01340, partial [Pyrinomonadaceae bacterium]|nr:hypothetical protein [Pyrinomonadaceae bacterium]
MRVAKLLILIGPDSSAEFAAALREILSAPLDPALGLRQEVVEHGGDFSPDELARLMSELNPDLCFVPLRARGGGRAGELLGRVRTCA